jgi:hypothetical protein
LTLGLGDVLPPTAQGRLLVVLEAGVGCATLYWEIQGQSLA